MNYHKLNQVVSSIAADVSDVISLLELINTSPDLANAFFSISVTGSILLSAGKTSDIPLLSYLRGVSSLQPYIIIWFIGILMVFPPYKVALGPLH